MKNTLWALCALTLAFSIGCDKTEQQAPTPKEPVSLTEKAKAAEANLKEKSLELIENGKEGAEELTSKVKETAANMSEKAGENIEIAKESISETTEDVKEGTNEAIKSSKDKLSETKAKAAELLGK